MLQRSVCRVLAAAHAAGGIALMVDVKMRSPRDGVLIRPERLEHYVVQLLDGGVDALSTVTDPLHFGGSIEAAARIRRVTDVPLMRKDFFRTVDQMDQSRDAGFDAVQLSLSTVPDLDLLSALRDRAQALDLDVVIGVHGMAQLACAALLGAVAVGVNNRDIARLELGSGTVEHGTTVLDQVPEHVLAIAQSAFRTGADLAAQPLPGRTGWCSLIQRTPARSSTRPRPDSASYPSSPGTSTTGTQHDWRPPRGI